MMIPCPITGNMIPRRYAVHKSVFDAALKAGKVIPNPTAGTLRRFIYIGRRNTK